MTNWAASLAEDGLTALLLFLAVKYPVAAAIAAALVVVLAAALATWMWRAAPPLSRPAPGRPARSPAARRTAGCSKMVHRRAPAKEAFHGSRRVLGRRTARSRPGSDQARPVASGADLPLGLLQPIHRAGRDRAGLGARVLRALPRAQPRALPRARALQDGRSTPTRATLTSTGASRSSTCSPRRARTRSRPSSGGCGPSPTISCSCACASGSAFVSRRRSRSSTGSTDST